MPRPRRYVGDSDYETESDYSETDVSFDRRAGRTRVKRRSLSRVRRESPASNAFLSPVVMAPVRRSASTGGRHRRTGDDPVVIVDVHNDVHARQDARDNRRAQLERRYAVEDDIEETEIIRSRRRPKVVADIEVSRTPSPRHQDRDWELLMDQRILASNDHRQDIELANQRQEIERLERQLAQSREKRREERHGSVSRRRIAEEEMWEGELAERLRRLDRLERSKRSEEEQKLADYRAKVKRLEEIEKSQRSEEEQKLADYRAKVKRLEEIEKSQRIAEEQKLADYRAKVSRLEAAERKAAEEEEARRLAKIKRLEEIERREAEEEEAKRLAQEKHLKELEKQEKVKAERERLIKELKDEEARKTLEEMERKKELAEVKRKAIEEWKMAEEARKTKEKKEQEEKDKEFRERLKVEFGYSEEQIEKMLKKKHDQEEKKDAGESLVILEPRREKTTFIRVNRKYLLPETLDYYKLPWEFDVRDGNFLIIKQYVSEEFQEQLFEHTRRIRAGNRTKLITETSETLTELRVNDRKRDKMYLVRKKGPNKAWIFT